MLSWRYLYQKYNNDIFKGNLTYNPYPLLYKIYCARNPTKQQSSSIFQKNKQNAFAPHAMPLGYFHNIAYLDNLYPILQKDFTLAHSLSKHNQKLKGKILNTKESVFLYVRLGD